MSAVTIEQALSFFRAVIQSGEPWSDVCEETYRGAVASLRERKFGPLDAQLAEALSIARNGLRWYQDRYPSAVENFDHEALEQINAALEAYERAKLAPQPSTVPPLVQQIVRGVAQELAQEVTRLLIGYKQAKVLADGEEAIAYFSRDGRARVMTMDMNEQMTSALKAAFEAGWRTASNWMERDDLISDVGSPAYEADMDKSVSKILAAYEPSKREQQAQAMSVLAQRSLDAAALLNALGRYDRAQPLRDAVHAIFPESAKSMDASSLPTQQAQAVDSAWRPIDELPESDDLFWFLRGDTVDGPRPPQHGGYDVEEWDFFAPCIEPQSSPRLPAQQAPSAEAVATKPCPKCGAPCTTKERTGAFEMWTEYTYTTPPPSMPDGWVLVPHNKLRPEVRDAVERTDSHHARPDTFEGNPVTSMLKLDWHTIRAELLRLAAESDDLRTKLAEVDADRLKAWANETMWRQRAEQVTSAKLVTTPPEPRRFIDNGDGTITDTTTGLMWSKATIGDDGMLWNDADKACRELAIAGHSDWRLPTRAELLSLVDDTRHAPAIDTEAFRDTESDWYWTSTPSAWASSCAWVVNFEYGPAYSIHRDEYAFVRAVRSAAADCVWCGRA